MLPAAAGWALRALKDSAKNTHSTPHSTASRRTGAGPGRSRSRQRLGRGGAWRQGRNNSASSRAQVQICGRKISQGRSSRTDAQKQTASSALPYTAASSGVRPGACGPKRRASSQPGAIR